MFVKKEIAKNKIVKNKINLGILLILIITPPCKRTLVLVTRNIIHEHLFVVNTKFKILATKAVNCYNKKTRVPKKYSSPSTNLIKIILQVSLPL